MKKPMQSWSDKRDSYAGQDAGRGGEGGGGHTLRTRLSRLNIAWENSKTLCCVYPSYLKYPETRETKRAAALLRPSLDCVENRRSGFTLAMKESRRSSSVALDRIITIFFHSITRIS